MLPKRFKVYGIIGFGVWALIIIYIVKVNFFSDPVGLKADHESHWLKDDAFYHDIINICMSSDENRLIGLVAAVRSIYKNTKYPVKFNILVTKAAFQPLKDWFSRTELKSIHCNIKVFDIERITEKVHVHSGRQDLAKPMNYARFYYTDYFPELSGHAVHIDDDCIVQGDVFELSHVGLNENHSIAFSNDCTTVSKRFAGSDRAYFKYINFTNPHVQSAGLDPMECSFNTGIYVFDVERWKAYNITQQLEYWMMLNTRERVYGNIHGGGGSQPPLMIVFHRQYILLNPLWNVRHLGMPSAGHHYSAEMISSAKLLHWSGPIKPWQSQAAYTHVWDKYFLPDPDHKYQPVRKYNIAP